MRGRAWRVCLGATCLGLTLAAEAASAPLVIGQSLPVTGTGFPIANRVQAGAKALVDRINANGGIAGRPIELVTLDDGGDPRRVAANLRRLVREFNALAIVNCLGERACREAAAATRELDVPLIGALSGAAALRVRELPQVFTLRPDDARESAVLARQLRAIGVSRAVLLADASEPERTEALGAALVHEGVDLTRLDTSAAAVEAGIAQALKRQPQALVFNVGSDTLDALSRLPQGTLEGVPSTIAMLSSPGLTQLTRLFRDRVIGFTSVVPNPEGSQLPIVREFQRDVDAYVGPEAITFEGFESYLHLRLCAEALRRAGGRFDSARLVAALEGLGTLDLGGFRFSFSHERHHAATPVEIGLRARDGRVLH